MYGFIDSLNPHNIPYFRTVLSVFNTLASLGCFFLAWRLCRSYWAGLVALVFASVYPPFSVQTGRLFPDPITGCLLVWSAYLFLRGAQEKSKRAMFGAGLTLTAALFIRPQLFNYVLLLLLVSVATTAYWWWREHKPLVAALLLGCLPFTSLWVGIVQAVGDDLEEIEAFGNFTFQQRYPYASTMPTSPTTRYRAFTINGRESTHVCRRLSPKNSGAISRNHPSGTRERSQSTASSLPSRPSSTPTCLPISIAISPT